MTKIEILKKAKEMACHNLFCYSKNYAMTVPKEGYEKDWQATKDEVKILESMIDEIENPPVVKITLDQLERSVMQLKKERQYRDMSSNLLIRICAYPNGKRYFEIEQSSPYAECNAHYERLEMSID